MLCLWWFWRSFQKETRSARNEKEILAGVCAVRDRWASVLLYLFGGEDAVLGLGLRIGGNA